MDAAHGTELGSDYSLASLPFAAPKDVVAWSRPGARGRETRAVWSYFLYPLGHERRVHLVRIKLARTVWSPTVTARSLLQSLEILRSRASHDTPRCLPWVLQGRRTSDQALSASMHEPRDRVLDGVSPLIFPSSCIRAALSRRRSTTKLMRSAPSTSRKPTLERGSKDGGISFEVEESVGRGEDASTQPRPTLTLRRIAEGQQVRKVRDLRQPGGGLVFSLDDQRRGGRRSVARVLLYCIFRG